MNVIGAGYRRVRALRQRVPAAVRPHLDRLERVEIHLRDLARQVDALRAAAEGAGLAQSERAELRVHLAQELSRLRSENVELARKVDDLRSPARPAQALLAEQGQPMPEASALDPEDEHVAHVPAAPRFTHATPGFDLLYRAFEDRYRGTRELITDRQSTDYLELLTSLPRPELAIADLGCGRGEFVRMLDDAGQLAIGVDANHGQIPESEARLFTEGDLFTWLDNRPDRSVRAVVAMHVVEHLPLDLQVRLVFEARRILVFDGLLIIETPNALSITTAASSFWLDPTHERPVHPLLLEFLAEGAGFASSELRPLHPVTPPLRSDGGSPELVDDLSERLLGCGDIALIARR